MTTTGYAIYTNGHIEEGGREVFPELVYEAKTKAQVIKYAKDNNLDIHSHHIEAVGYELIQGLKVPESGEPEFLNEIL